MILTLAAGLILANQQAPSKIVCPITAEEVGISFANIDFAGARFEMCCGGCPSAFKKDPSAALKNEKLKGKTFGVFLFDPVSNKRINEKDAKASSDYKGLRYFFASEDEKKSFDATPKNFVHKVTKEVLTCPVAGSAIKTYEKAGGFMDINGVRYYTCCADCLAKLKADQSIAAKSADKAVDPIAEEVPKQ